MKMDLLENLTTKIFADGADLSSIQALAKNPLIKGFTTNPTLMRKAGISDYEEFGRQVLSMIPDKPISLEVFADELSEMEKQARYISSWGSNVNIKIPVTNTRGEFTGPVIERLSKDGITLNITAIMTTHQVRHVAECFDAHASGIISVFAGRIADTGVDAEHHMSECMEILSPKPKLELLWASPRELFNLFQADRIGCHIITISHDMLAKLTLIQKDLVEYSLETVQMFRKDAMEADYTIDYQAEPA